MGWLCLTAITVATLALCLSSTKACNEAVCASLVSKCMLLKSCECNMLDKDNCTCCKDCHKCLSTLYTQCCSCVGMCPESNKKSNMYKTSTVEELDEPVPALFSVLTEEHDELERWSTYTYPAHLDLLYFQPRGHSLNLDLASSLAGKGTTIRHGKHHIDARPHADTTNCTVAYMAQCMSLTKCRDSCQSMGAARYRWFHEYGCCECIGSTCLDYGKGEPLCLHCPSQEDQVDRQEAGQTAALAGNGLLDKEITVETLGSDGGLTGENEEDIIEEPLTLSGGRLDTASLALGGETPNTKKSKKHMSHLKHHDNN